MRFLGCLAIDATLAVSVSMGCSATGSLSQDAGAGLEQDDGSDPACPIACPSDEAAVIEFTCGPTDLSSVTLSGPCAPDDAGSHVQPGPGSFVDVTSQNPGICHVALTFAVGFTYALDVTFTAQTQGVLPGCPACPSFVGPTQSTYLVDNPSATCLPTGGDAGGDAPLDSPSAG